MRLRRVDAGGAVGVFARIPFGDPGMILSPYGEGNLYRMPVPRLYDDNTSPPDPAPPNYREQPLVVWGVDAKGNSTWTLPVAEGEWWLHELARHLDVSPHTLHGWRKKGWVRARQLGGRGGPWAVWAGGAELARLGELTACPRVWASRARLVRLRRPSPRGQ